MARIKGVERGGSPLARIAFLTTRRKVGRVIRPVRVHARQFESEGFSEGAFCPLPVTGPAPPD